MRTGYLGMAEQPRARFESDGPPGMTFVVILCVVLFGVLVLLRHGPELIASLGASQPAAQAPAAAPAQPKPAQFYLQHVRNAAPGQRLRSNTVRLQGYKEPAVTVSVSGGAKNDATLIVDEVDTQQSSVTVGAAPVSIAIRATAPADYGQSVRITLTAGATSAEWLVATPARPAGSGETFKLDDIKDAQVGQRYRSNELDGTMLPTRMLAVLTSDGDATLVLNGVDTGLTRAPVNKGDTVAVEMTSPDLRNRAHVAQLALGDKTKLTWRLETGAEPNLARLPGAVVSRLAFSSLRLPYADLSAVNDGLLSTDAQSLVWASVPETEAGVGYEFAVPETVRSIVIDQGVGPVSTIEVSGSVNGSDWETLYEAKAGGTLAEVTLPFWINRPFRFWRVMVPAEDNTAGWMISEVQMFR